MIPFDWPNNIRYSFYSYLSSKTLSFLNPIVLKGIKWIISRSRIFPGIKPHVIWWQTTSRNFWPSFMKIWCGVWKIWQKLLIFDPFLTLIPYNPEIKNFFQKSAWNIFSIISSYHQDTTLCKVSEKSDARFSRYGVTHAHTHAHTHARTTLNA